RIGRLGSPPFANDSQRWGTPRPQALSLQRLDTPAKSPLSLNFARISRSASGSVHARGGPLAAFHSSQSPPESDMLMTVRDLELRPLHFDKEFQPGTLGLGTDVSQRTQLSC